MDKYDALKLENQLCFPLYAAARQVIRLYRPHLDALGLTYTQYIVMMVLWEAREISVKELGRKLYLDSGTLTPVLKSLEAKGFVSRRRSTEDERVLLLELTEMGIALRERALEVPQRVGGCIPLGPEDGAALFLLLHKLLDAVSQEGNNGA